MLSPKRTKYRKYHRGHMRGKATKGNNLCFGDFGLQAIEPTWITSRQIEAARRIVLELKNNVEHTALQSTAPAKNAKKALENIEELIKSINI